MSDVGYKPDEELILKQTHSFIKKRRTAAYFTDWGLVNKNEHYFTYGEGFAFCGKGGF